MFYLADKRGGGKVLFQRFPTGIAGMYFDTYNLFDSFYTNINNTLGIVECDVLSIIRSADSDADYLDVLYNDLRKCYTGLNRIPADVGSTVRGQLLKRPLYRIHNDVEGKKYIQLIYPLKRELNSRSFNEVVGEIRVD